MVSDVSEPGYRVAMERTPIGTTDGKSGPA